MAPHCLSNSATPTAPSTPAIPNGVSTALRSNSPHAGWVIQKFGGTSVGKFPVQIAEEIVGMYLNNHRVAIVCSARSTDTKAEGTTNRLIAAAAEALKPGSTQYVEIVAAIQEDHVRVAKELLRTPEIVEELVRDIQTECVRLGALLGAAQTLDEISPKTQDAVIGTGEKLSCLFMTALLRDRGIDAEYVNLDHVYTHVPTPNGQGLGQTFYTTLAQNIADRIRQCGDRIPVITGYFGVVPGSLLTSIGRGYTDLCAALLAVGLDADELQVWKEVDGIFTADPRKVSTARLIPVITPEEAAELTYYGSEVIHPFTMEQVIKARIPIRIKNVENPTGPGTMIFPDNQPRKGEETPTQPPRHIRLARADTLLQPLTKRPTAVTTKSGMVVLNVHSNRKSLSHGFLASIFSTLDKWQLCVDLISTSEVHVSMALHSEAKEPAIKMAIEELRKYGVVDVTYNLTILSVVGKHMKRMIGIAGRMFSTLADAGVNIEMISQGASEINISCVIKQEDAIRAVNVLHTRLFTYQDL
ncbi:aspartate kinase [Ascodesmis nigricans]|uniref:Aspartokinase n=1 Tax=Ascodesmis nigricans TaxID=341454 RepID=A0A4S2N8N5_9PEZI|nr:aspartate kinase [Ascodesmis nigricans]